MSTQPDLTTQERTALAAIVTADAPVLRSTVPEAVIDVLAKAQMITWGRDSPSMRQTIPCTLIPTWVGTAIHYRNAYHALREALRTIESDARHAVRDAEQGS